MNTDVNNKKRLITIAIIITFILAFFTGYLLGDIFTNDYSQKEKEPTAYELLQKAHEKQN